MSPTAPVNNQRSTLQPAMTASPAPSSQIASQTKSSSGFDDLWTMSLGSSSAANAAGGGKSIKDLEKEKASAGIWGSSHKSQASAGAFGPLATSASSKAPTSDSGVDDLLF